MAMTFRDIKGSPLTPAEVDGNFRTLQTLIDGFVSADGVGIASFESIGAEAFRVHLTDGSTQGPFALPKAAFVWRDAWVGGTSYSPFDVFTVAEDGVYLVLRAYEAATEFDPSVSDTEGALLSKMFGTPPVGRIPIVNSSGTYTALPSNTGSYVRVDGGNFSIAASPDWEVGDVFTIRRVSTDVNVVGDTATDILVPDGSLASLRAGGSTATIIYTGGDTWELSGDLALATTTGP